MNNFLNHFSVTRHCRDYHPANVTTRTVVIRQLARSKTDFLSTIIHLRSYVAAPRVVTSMPDSHGLRKCIVTDPNKCKMDSRLTHLGGFLLYPICGSRSSPPPPPGADPSRLVPNTNANTETVAETPGIHHQYHHCMSATINTSNLLLVDQISDINSLANSSPVGLR